MLEGKYYLENGLEKPVSEFAGFRDGDLYEVIKLVEGKPLFWNDHIERLKQSIALTHHQWYIDPVELKRQAKTLIELNQFARANIRISLRPDVAGGFETRLSLIPQNMPSSEWYTGGVFVSLLQKERKEPNAKQVQDQVKSQVNQKLVDHQIWEVLLVNTEGQITEGSRSNVFFVIDGVLVTPPGNQVLLGITRQKVIEICQRKNIPFREACVKTTELSDIESAFLTGTTPGVLPISNINEHKLNVDSLLMQEIRKEYQEWVRNNIAAYDF